MTSMIWSWIEEDEDYMLNEGDEKVWCSWNENGNWFYFFIKKTKMVKPTLSLHELGVTYP